MRRSEQREHIFKLLFMTQFNSKTRCQNSFPFILKDLENSEEKDQEAYAEEIPAHSGTSGGDRRTS